MDKVSKEIRSNIMSRIRSHGTSLESKVKEILWRSGIRYRKSKNNLFGNPDITIKNKKIVIFIDSCFWHGCIIHLRKPSTNTAYWDKKIERNIERDKKVSSFYITKKWNIFRIWEHDIHDFKLLRNKINEIKAVYSKA